MEKTKSQGSRLGRWVIITTFIVLFLGAAVAYSTLHNLPDPSRLGDRTIAQSTKIYDRTGQTLLYEIHGEEKRTVVPFNEIPDSIKKATLAAEDLNFYNHFGLDWRGIIRAIVANLRSGDTQQGGSTITQQLVKNSLLTPEKTYTRKLKEAVLALKIESQYSKDDILGFYLNQIPYGSNAYGVSAAAQTFFGKPANNLTLAEAATLVALPKAPTYYSPYGTHKDELHKRVEYILDRMSQHGMITTKEAEDAKNTQVAFLPPHQSILAPHFVMYVREYLNEKYGENYVEQGGLKVITTLDIKLQEQAEKIIRDGVEQNEKAVQASNAGLIAIDPKTGEILSMVGSRDYFGTPLPTGCAPGKTCRFDPNTNVTVSSRQPGSSFKPFIYATAFKKGYTLGTILFDVFTEFNSYCNPDGTGPDNTNCYHPQNYDGQYRGPVTLRSALGQSLNVPAVKLLYLAGVSDSIATAREMGISTLGDGKRYGLSLVLGGAEVNLLDMTSAYGVFAADGILHPKTSILRIEDLKGNVLEEAQNSELPVIDSQVARTMNDVLSDNNARLPEFSPNSSLYFSSRQVAAKTGTTQDYRDAWIVGYTPSLVAGVWVGNNDNTPLRHSGPSAMVAGPLWHQFMNFALSNTPVEHFPTPEPKTVSNQALLGTYRTGPYVKIDTISGKQATADTPPELVKTVALGEPKTILALVDKNNPNGPPPSNPESDPQYQNWQAGIAAWAASQPPPTVPDGFDDAHTADTKPKISFLIPNQDIVSSLTEVRVSLDSKFPLKEVQLFINQEMVGSKTAPILPGELSLSLQPPLRTGTYDIQVIAYDEAGNKQMESRRVQVQ